MEDNMNNNRLRRINAAYNITPEISRLSSPGCPLKRADSTSDIHLRLLQNEKKVTFSSMSKQKSKKMLVEQVEVNNNNLRNDKDLLLVPKVEIQAYAAIVVSDSKSQQQDINNDKTGSITSNEGRELSNNLDDDFSSRHHHHHHKHHHHKHHHHRSSKIEGEGLNDDFERKEKRRSKRSSKDHERPKSEEVDDDYDKNRRKSHRQSDEKDHRFKSIEQTEGKDEGQHSKKQHHRRSTDENRLSNDSQRKLSEVDNDTGRGPKNSHNLRKTHGQHRKSKGSEGHKNERRSSDNDKNLIPEHRHVQDEFKEQEESVDNEDGHRHYRKRYSQRQNDSGNSNASNQPQNRHRNSKQKREARRGSKDRRHHGHPRTLDKTKEENFLVKRYIEASVLEKNSPRLVESEQESIARRNKSYSKNKKMPPSTNKQKSKSLSKEETQKCSKSLKNSNQTRTKSVEIQTVEPTIQVGQELPLLDTSKDKSNNKKPSDDLSKHDQNFNTKIPGTDLNDDLTATEGIRTRLPSYVFQPLDEKVKQKYLTFQLTEVEPGAKKNRSEDNPPEVVRKSKAERFDATGVGGLEPSSMSSYSSAEGSPKANASAEATDMQSDPMGIVVMSSTSKATTVGGGDGANLLQNVAVVELGADSKSYSSTRVTKSNSRRVTKNKSPNRKKKTKQKKAPTDSPSGSQSKSGSESKSMSNKSSSESGSDQSDESEDESKSSGYGKSSGINNSSGKPSLVMTEKGAIRFQLPGRIQHKTTIKLSHYPENSEETVVVNVPDENADSCCDKDKAQENETGNVQQCGQPYGFCADPCQQNYYMNQGEQCMQPMQQMQMQALQLQQQQLMYNGNNYSYNCYNPFNPYSYGCGYPPC